MRKRGTTTWDREREPQQECSPVATSTPTTPIIISASESASDPAILLGLTDAQFDEVNGIRPRSGEQRQKHNAVERRRKKAIKEAMDELVDLLPEKQSKPTQLSILKAAIDYIKQLKKENDALRGNAGRVSATNSPVLGKRARLDVPRCSPLMRSSSDSDAGYVYSSDDDTETGRDCSPLPFAHPTLQQQPSMMTASTSMLPVYPMAALSATGPAMSNPPSYVPQALSGSFLQLLQNDNAACMPIEDSGARELSYLPTSLLPSGFDGAADNAFSCESLSCSTSSTSSSCSMQVGSGDFDLVLARFLSTDDNASAAC